MCYDLIAAHKVESMCAAQRTGMRHLEHSSGSTGEQALNISHISHQGISGSHQASLCLWIIWSILEGWVSFGGERIFEGTGSKSTSGSCSCSLQQQSKRKPPTFHTFHSKEFLAATKRHPACAWLIWSICNRDEGVSLAGILSQPALAWDYVQEEEEAINNQLSIILMGLTQLRSKVWVLWSNIKRRRFFLLNFYPETCPQKKHNWNTSQLRFFWGKKLLTFCCDPLSGDLRGLGGLVGGEEGILLRGLIRAFVETCTNIKLYKTENRKCEKWNWKMVKTGVHLECRRCILKLKFLTNDKKKN